MQFWVYLLRCADGSYYAGHSDNLEGRLWQHQQGIGCEWTRRRRPVEFVWCDCAPTREEAIAFERRIKGWTRAKKEALIAGDWDRISWLARAPHERPSTQPVLSDAAGGVDGLRTNEVVPGTNDSVRPERSRASGVVEGRLAQPSRNRPSTTLRTNDLGARQ